MKEWIYRRGYEEIPNGFKPKWYHYIMFISYPILLQYASFNRRYFVDLINDKGKIRRIYVEETGK